MTPITRVDNQVSWYIISDSLCRHRNSILFESNRPVFRKWMRGQWGEFCYEFRATLDGEASLRQPRRLICRAEQWSLMEHEWKGMSRIERN